MKTIFWEESNGNGILREFRKILFRKAELRLGPKYTLLNLIDFRPVESEFLTWSFAY